MEILRHLESCLPPKTTNAEMEQWNLKLCLHDTQSVRWLDTAQRRFLSSSVDDDAACAFQLMHCDFPNHKDKSEELAGHVDETMTPSFIIVQSVTTNHTNDLRQCRGLGQTGNWNEWQMLSPVSPFRERRMREKETYEFKRN